MKRVEEKENANAFYSAMPLKLFTAGGVVEEAEEVREHKLDWGLLCVCCVGFVCEVLESIELRRL